MSVLRIASTSAVSLAAGAVANAFREEGRVELVAIGPKAVNQAVKSIAIARGYLASSGVDLYFVPAFVEMDVGHETRTGMSLDVRSGTPVPELRPRRRAHDAPPRRDSHAPHAEEWSHI